MLKLKLAKPMLVALAACAASVAFNGVVFADDAETQALKDQMRYMQQQMQQLQNQIDALSKKQAAPPAAGAPAEGPSVAKKEAPAEPLFDKFVKGFYGTLDVSIDDSTKGMNGFVAYPYSYVDPANPNSGYVRGPAKGGGAGPVGRVGWEADLSTNKSVIGWRGAHDIIKSGVDFIDQIEVQPAITSAPGASTSYTAQSNTTKAGIGYGDSFVGLSGNSWGKIKAGTTYTPYKKSTDRMNPFSGMLGDYAVIMGNTGGDNRVEFGTRLGQSIWYESPQFFHVVSFDVLFAPGQNRTYDNVVQSAGSPDCNGGNSPGSGNLPLNCDDGSFGTAWSADIKVEAGGFYGTVAYELHKDVNRNSDGIGSNSPIYGAQFAASGNCANPSAAPLLDCAGYNTYLGEYGAQFVNANGFTPEFANDVANESAFKTGLEYTFDFGLSVGSIYEYLKRFLPADMQYQNERTRDGWWFFLTQDVGAADNVSLGYAHAGATPGDPAGQHNYNPTVTDDTADLYTIAWKHRFDKHFYAYADFAETQNHGNSHYDLGAGGRSLTTDCHDGTNTVVNDYSSAGPTTWGGDQCKPIGFSVGMNYKF
jgi:predicted porin